MTSVLAHDMENMGGGGGHDLKYYKNTSIPFLSRIPPFYLFIYDCLGFGFIEVPTAAESLECFVSILLVLVLQKLLLA